MALSKAFKHPYKPGTFTGYAWVAEVNLNVASGVGRIVVFVHESEEAAREGYPPLLEYPLELRREGTPATYGAPPLLSPGSPAVTQQVQTGTDEEGNPIFETVVITPASDPVYGEPVQIEAPIPPFFELLLNQRAAYTAIMTAAYSIILGRKQFEGASVIPTSHLGM